MTNEEIILSIENDTEFNFEPKGGMPYKTLLENITQAKKLNLINDPSISKMKEILIHGHRSLNLLQQYYLLPLLLMDFNRKDTKFLYDKNRLNNYLQAFWFVVEEMGMKRTFEVYMLEKCERILNKSEGIKSNVLSKIVSSIEKLNQEYDTVQIAYSSMIVEKLIRIQSLELFHALHKEEFIANFEFEDVNNWPLSRLLDCHFDLTEKGKQIYKCLKKENSKAFAFNTEFRKMSKDILVDRKKWSIRNRHIHSALDISNESTADDNKIIRLYLVYFILKHNTSLLTWNWEYLQDHWDEIHKNDSKNK